MRKSPCMWFGDICSGCFLTALPGPAWVLLKYVLQRLFLSSVILGTLQTLIDLAMCLSQRIGREFWDNKPPFDPSNQLGNVERDPGWGALSWMMSAIFYPSSISECGAILRYRSLNMSPSVWCGCFMRIAPSNVACVTLHTFSKLLSQQTQDRQTGIRKERDVSKGFTPSIPLLSFPDSFLREKRTNMVIRHD